MHCDVIDRTRPKRDAGAECLGSAAGAWHNGSLYPVI